MKPALTAEEWAADSIRREDKDGNVLVIVRDRSENTEEAGGRCHAVAAIGLHGKAFGFSHADRELLFRVFHFVRKHGAEADADALSDLESRIKALLPPRE